MNNTKIFAKICLLLHIVSAIVMVSIGLYDSFSQHSTSTLDWLLTIYLVSAVLVFTTLALKSNKSDFRIHLRWAKIRFWQIYLFIAMMFVGIRATNVVDYSIENPEETDGLRVVLHYVFTGLAALSALTFAWHKYTPRTSDRKWTILACFIGIIGFGTSLLSTWFEWNIEIFGRILNISLGEFLISLAISMVTWPTINEQLN